MLRIFGMFLLMALFFSTAVTSAQDFTDEEFKRFTEESSDAKNPYQDQMAELKPWSQEMIDNYYRRNWKTLAKGYVKVGEHFFRARDYVEKEDSSRKLDYFKWIRENTERKKVGSAASGTSFTRTITLRPSDEEAHVVTRALPNIKRNDWGYISSIKVVNKRGKNRDIIIGSQVQVIDAQDVKERYDKQKEKNKRTVDRISDNAKKTDQRTRLNNQLDKDFAKQNEFVSKQKSWEKEKFYLIGFDEYDPQEGNVLKARRSSAHGIKVIILVDDLYNLKASLDQEERASRRRRQRDGDQKIMMPTSQLRNDLTEAQFMQLLEEADLTKEDFVNMARAIDEETTGTRIELIRPKVQGALDIMRWKKYKAMVKEQEESKTRRPTRPTRVTRDTTTSRDTSTTSSNTQSNTRTSSNSDKKPAIENTPQDVIDTGLGKGNPANTSDSDLDDLTNSGGKDPKQTRKRKMPDTDY